MAAHFGFKDWVLFLSMGKLCFVQVRKAQQSRWECSKGWFAQSIDRWPQVQQSVQRLASEADGGFWQMIIFCGYPSYSPDSLNSLGNLMDVKGTHTTINLQYMYNHNRHNRYAVLVHWLMMADASPCINVSLP